MKNMKILSFSAALLATSSLYAEISTDTKTPPPYGDNPNIFKVLAHKTGEKVQNTAERVGAAAERGVEKIKPKVDDTWQEAKTYTEEQSERAKAGLQRGADKVAETANHTRDAIVGTNKGSVPIEFGSLSQSSTISAAPQTTSQTLNHTTAQAIPLETPAPIAASEDQVNTTNVTQPNQNVTEPDEPDISLKSLPLPQTTQATDTTQPSTEKEDIPQ